jgi:hypothetical protein
VGIGLFLDVSAKQAVGIALLGIAFSWLIGSLTPRALVVASAILLCAAGLYIAVPPVRSDWKSTKESAAYDLAIADLQAAVRGAATYDNPYAAFGGNLNAVPPIGRVVSIPEVQDALLGSKTDRIVRLPHSVEHWVRPSKETGKLPGGPDGMPIHWERYVENAPATQAIFPGTMPDSEIMRIFKSSILLPRPTSSLGSTVRAHAWPVFAGLALFASGLSLLGWMFRQTRVERQGNHCTANSWPKDAQGKR